MKNSLYTKALLARNSTKFLSLSEKNQDSLIKAIGKLESNSIKKSSAEYTFIKKLINKVLDSTVETDESVVARMAGYLRRDNKQTRGLSLLVENNSIFMRIDLLGTNAKSRYPGSIMIQVYQGSEGPPIIVGRITQKGKLLCTDYYKPYLITSIKTYFQDIEAAAGKYGLIFPHCCYCKNPLISDVAKLSGYHPGCFAVYNRKKHLSFTR